MPQELPRSGLFEQRRTSFGGAVDAARYDAVRPPYPAEAAHWLAGEPDAPVRVLDLGAGTGKLSRLLADQGHEVVAVDRSAAMLEALAGTPRVETRVGDAEALPLPDASVDAVTVAQAWHWFDVDAACAEVARVLRPGGVLGVVWNIRDGRLGWVTELDEILGGGTAGDCETVEWGDWLDLPEPFGHGERRLFGNDLRLDVEGLVALAASTSVVQIRDDRDEVLRRIEALARRVAGDDGRLVLPHFCRCYRYRRP